MPYGISDSTWIRLPPDDQAAIIAQSKGQPPPAIGGYAPAAPSSVPNTTAPKVAPPAQATPAPPPNLTAASGSAKAVTGKVKDPAQAPIGAWTLAAREAQPRAHV